MSSQHGVNSGNHGANSNNYFFQSTISEANIEILSNILEFLLLETRWDFARIPIVFAKTLGRIFQLGK